MQDPRSCTSTGGIRCRHYHTWSQILPVVLLLQVSFIGQSFSVPYLQPFQISFLYYRSSRKKSAASSLPFCCRNTRLFTTTTTTTTARSMTAETQTSSSSNSKSPTTDRVLLLRGGGGDGNEATTSNERNILVHDNATSYKNITLPVRDYGYLTKPLSWEDLIQIVQVDYELGKLSRSKQQQYDYELALVNMKQEWNSTYDFILHTKFNFTKKKIQRPNPKDATTNRSTTSSSSSTSTTNDSEKEEEGIGSQSASSSSSSSYVWIVDPPLSEIKQIKKVLVKNDFPYYMEDGIQHYVLWKTCQNITEDEIQVARNELQEIMLRTEGVQEKRQQQQQQQQQVVEQQGDDVSTMNEVHDDDDDDHDDDIINGSSSSTSRKVVEIIHWMNPPHLQSLPDIYHVHFVCRVVNQKEEEVVEE